MSSTGIGRWRRLLAVCALVGTTPLLMAPASVTPVSVAAPTPQQLLGSQGTDVALSDTDSAVTVPGVGRYRQMSFHLSKTRALTNEAISITWTGGDAGTPIGPLESTNFVQLMQCWGDPVVAADSSSGPPPEQCVFGADPDDLRVNATNNGFEFIRARMPAVEDWVPFRAVNGTVVAADTGINPNNPSSSAWVNPFYTKFTSNEIGGLRNNSDGSGSAFFEIHTGLQSAGLGCGQKLKSGGYPRCWLVAVPRGAHDDVAGVDDRGQAATTPLDTRGPWKNRVAIPLDFTPVASSCALSNAQQSISGADLSLPAMDRWLPRLCTQAGAPPYIYTRTQDDRARTLLLQRANGGAGDGMIVTDTPLDSARLPAGRSAVYAPLDISAVVVGFSIQRNNVVDGQPASVQDAFQRFQSSYVGHIRLTPRLVAKLLTQSYGTYLQPGTFLLPEDNSKARYAWSLNNPKTMLFDPDFQAANPEFTVLGPIGTESATSLEVSLGSSAAATAVWKWIGADPAATKWLSGAADQWGMTVNPYFSTNAKQNPNQVAFVIPPSGGFPKNDPLTWITPDAALFKLPALSLNNEWPYQDSLTSTARVTRTGNRGAKINFDPNSPLGYAPSGTQALGARAMLSITDAADAQRFGIQTAALQNANGDFVEPTADGLRAGVAAMVPDPTSGVLQPDYRAKVKDAYPLTSVDYATAVPSVLTAKERSDYSRLITYVAGPGQITGEALGQLPRGYLALPPQLRAQSLAAAFQVASGTPALPLPTPTTEPTPTSHPSSSTSAGRTTARVTTSVRSSPASATPTTPAAPPQAAGDNNAAPPDPGGSDPSLAPAAAGPARASGPVRRTAAPTSSAGAKVISATTAPADTTVSATGALRLAAVTTGADPVAAPWVAILFIIGVAAALLVPIVGRTHNSRRN